jgi:hypothetical protein
LIARAAVRWSRIDGVHCPECGARENGELHSTTCKIGAAIFELKRALAPA